MRSCFKRAVGTNLSDPADGASCALGLYAPPPGADAGRGHRRTIEDIRGHWIKSFTGNSAIYSERTVRALVASPSVKRLHAFFKYGYLVDEHFWAIALGLIEESDGDAACPRAFLAPLLDVPKPPRAALPRFFAELFGDARAFLRDRGDYVSDRRLRKCADLVRVAARANGRGAVGPLDALLAAHVLWQLSLIHI